MSDMEAKRAANIKAKEEKKKAEVDAIKAKKLEKQAEREKSTAEGKQKEEADAKAKEELEKKREANIASKDKSRAVKNAQKKGGSSKYSKKDVYELQAVFNEYDKDGSGKVTMTEFGDALKNKKNKNAPRPGEKSTLAQRQANEGISILDLSESVFHEMDTDGDGEVRPNRMSPPPLPFVPLSLAISCRPCLPERPLRAERALPRGSHPTPSLLRRRPALWASLRSVRRLPSCC